MGKMNEPIDFLYIVAGAPVLPNILGTWFRLQILLTVARTNKKLFYYK